MNNLKKLREKHEYKQETLASYLNMTRQNYSRIENGQQKLSDDILRKLRDFYNVSIDYILGYEDSNSEKIIRKLDSVASNLSDHQRDLVLDIIEEFSLKNEKKVK